jgi:fructokinase
MRIVSIGEVLWDVIGDQEFLGGAPLNFSVSCSRLGEEVVLLSGVGSDSRGSRAIEAIASLGLDPGSIQTSDDHLTGTASVEIDADGNPRFGIRRPAAFDCIKVDCPLLERLQQFRPGWIYFGTLAQTSVQNEATLSKIRESVPQARCFYDMNLRDGHWSPDLVQRLSGLASILKLNENEAEVLFRQSGVPGAYSIESFCRYWSAKFQIDLICVTLGPCGCAVWSDGSFLKFPGFPTQVADAVGAGDAFSAAFLHGLESGWPIDRVASFANALGSIVASRPGATPFWDRAECLQLIQSRVPGHAITW